MSLSFFNPGSSGQRLVIEREQVKFLQKISSESSKVFWLQFNCTQEHVLNIGKQLIDCSIRLEVLSDLLKNKFHEDEKSHEVESLRKNFQSLLNEVNDPLIPIQKLVDCLKEISLEKRSPSLTDSLDKLNELETYCANVTLKSRHSL